MAESNTALPSAFVAHAVAWSAKYNIEVHAIDTNSRVILDAQVNVFLDTKSKVPGLGEIPLAQFVLTNLLNQENQLDLVFSMYCHYKFEMERQNVINSPERGLPLLLSFKLCTVNPNHSLQQKIHHMQSD